MAKTLIGVNDPKAVKKYSAFLATDVARKSYFNSKMMGVGEDAETPIQMLPELESDAGDSISYDLSIQLRNMPTEGDDILEGTEEELRFYSDAVLIDQQRHGVNAGGRMTRKRTIHNLRAIARKRESDYWSRLFDETFFIYLSGARGVNSDFIYPTSWTGRAGNSLDAPDTNHIVYGGNATSKASVDSADTVTANLIDKVKTRAVTLGGGTEAIPRIQPIMIEGGQHFVFLMHSWQEYDLRVETGAAGWLELQKAAAGAEGNKNLIFRGSLGMKNNVILHSHEAVIVFSDYGAGANVSAARALFLGRQAGVIAFGSPGNDMRFDWMEETDDRGNQLVVTTHTIYGVKKTRYNSTDFGVISVDTAAAAPA